MFKNKVKTTTLKESSFKVQRVPKVGERVKFFDDGKSSSSRRYWATILKIIPAWQVMVFKPKLYRSWKRQLKDACWLYALRTDYFVKAYVEEYDEYPCYFVRTKDGRWFSIDYPHWWMSGLLDIDDICWNRIKKDGETFK